MADNEMREALREQNEHLDRIAKAQWLVYMATQEAMNNRTPSSMVFGSYNFNPTNSTTQLVAWRQVVPRNERRKRITFSALNQTLFLATSDQSIDIMSLVQFQNTGWSGSLPVMENTFTAGTVLQLDTTESIYIASLKGGGSQIEQTAIISWAEEIYSNVSAIPVHMVNESPERPGIIQKLPHSLQELDGDIQGTFTREGVR